MNEFLVRPNGFLPDRSDVYREDWDCKVIVDIVKRLAAIKCACVYVYVDIKHC